MELLATPPSQECGTIAPPRRPNDPPPDGHVTPAVRAGVHILGAEFHTERNLEWAFVAPGDTGTYLFVAFTLIT